MRLLYRSFVGWKVCWLKELCKKSPVFTVLDQPLLISIVFLSLFFFCWTFVTFNLLSDGLVFLVACLQCMRQLSKRMSLLTHAIYRERISMLCLFFFLFCLTLIHIYDVYACLTYVEFCSPVSCLLFSCFFFWLLFWVCSYRIVKEFNEI